MKKKVDTMTAISILLVVINLVLFCAVSVNRWSCVDGSRLVGQSTLNTEFTIRNDVKQGTSDNFFLVSNTDNISSNKIF